MGDICFLSASLRTSCFIIAASVTLGSRAWATGTDPIEPVAQQQLAVTAKATSVDPAASRPLPLNIQPIPEPGTLILLGLGAALTIYRPRRHSRRDPGP